MTAVPVANELPQRAGPVTEVTIGRVRPGSEPCLGTDHLVGEEPLEIRAGAAGQAAEPVAVTMRTPGDDFELATGFLITEGIAPGPESVLSVRYCPTADQQRLHNVVLVRLSTAVRAGVGARTYATSSCGLCGKASLDQLGWRCEPLRGGPRLASSVVVGMAGSLRVAQPLFDTTGGIHGAGLFDSGGRLVAAREDVGRHNAVDKLIGHAARAGIGPLVDYAVMVSGRVGYEIVQKVAMARVAVLCAVSAPTSLAVETAERFGVTLVGFVRNGGFNIYSHPERVELGC